MNRYLAIAIFLAAPVLAVEPPPPLPPLPSASQLAWEDNDRALFLNFGLNTFLAVEQGSGHDDPQLFNPSGLDAKQWVALAKECGFKRIVLAAKNHDGFCLWPSKFSEYSVRNSPWRDGKGDVVKEFTDACHAAGIEVGFYLSCEDRHHPSFGTPDYNRIYLGQLAELLSNYGPVAEVRFDGAGGVGSGAVGALDLPQKKQDYDWPTYFDTVRKLQPQAVMVSVVGPGARWNGNNIGHAGDPIWCPFNTKALPGPEPTNAEQLRVLNAGDPNGDAWLPPECFVRLRPHWSWRAEDDTNVLAPEKLFNAYCKSVGRGCGLLLNIAIDRDGRIPDIEAQRMRGLDAAIGKMFASDLARRKTPTASSERDPAFAVANAIDGDPTTFWAPADGGTNDAWLEVDLGGPTRFDTVAMAEPIALGQRVAAYRIEAEVGGQWKVIVHGTSIGHLKLERFDAVTADKVRLVIEKARACPLISRFSLYLR